MKQIFTIFLFTLFVSPIFAQTSNVVFFAEQGERFWVILNGIKQNETASTNVKVSDLNAESYKLKIIFEDASNGELDKNLFIKRGYETTFNIKLKQIGETSKDFKKGINGLTKELGMKKAYKDADETEKFVLRYISEVPLQQVQPPPPGSEQAVIVYHATPAPVATTTVTEQTTTTVVSGNQPGGTSENVSVNMNVQSNGNGAGFNMNTNTSSSATYTESVTTTTTVTSGGAPVPADQPVYVMPGYNGPIGCPMPMSDMDFNGARNSISSKTFEDSKLQVAQQVAGSNCLTANQVRSIMTLFDFEDTRLDFAKFAYHHTFDLGNYYKVNDAFDFELTIDELDEYINAQR